MANPESRIEDDVVKGFAAYLGTNTTLTALDLSGKYKLVIGSRCHMVFILYRRERYFWSRNWGIV